MVACNLSKTVTLFINVTAELAMSKQKISRREKSKPKLKQLAESLTPEFAVHWKSIGSSLGIPESRLNILGEDYSGDVQRCCNEMFGVWLDTDHKATWEKVLEAVDSVNKSNSTSSLKKSKQTTPLDDAVDTLRTRYLGQPSHGKTEFPKNPVIDYVKLALIKNENMTLEHDHINDLTKLTLQGGAGVDKILKKKLPINDLKEIFHYNNEPIPRMIIIMGGPGIGKTTLAKEICIKWARENFLYKDFNIVILIALRTVQQRSLEDVMIEQIGKEAYHDLTETKGAKCLIILEGLDEMGTKQQHSLSDPLFAKIINYIAFVKAVILITSRPHACQELIANRWIEIVGFGEQQIKTFVEKSFSNNKQLVTTFMEQIIKCPHIYSLCYVPVSLVMIIDIFNYKKHCLPSTLTELYQLFTVMTLVREMKRTTFVSSTAAENDDVEKIHVVLSCCSNDEIIRKILLLSKLAFYSFFENTPGDIEKHNGWRKMSNPKMIFNDGDLTKYNIKVPENFDGEGLLKAVTLHYPSGDCKTYNFIHLTVQEFLCALYMITLSQNEQCHLLNEYFDEYPNIMILYCGLTRLNVYEVVYSKLASYSSSVTAMKCLHEGQSSTAFNQLKSPFSLDMSYITLLPYDCHCLSYVFCHFPVTKLKMYMCCIGDKNAVILANWCSNQNKSTKLQELDLAENNVTSDGMDQVMKIVKCSPFLTILDVSENNIGDDGLSFCLHNVNTLIELSLEFCGLSAKGAQYIKNILMETENLDFLHIGKNDIGNDGLRHITEGLKKNSTLTKLKAYDCGFSEEGAISLSEMIKTNCTLQYLNINSNLFGDVGIKAIATTFNKSRISELIMYNCNISGTGAIRISEMIKLNHCLQYLDISSNPLGDQGITAITKVLNDSEISELIVYNCNITVHGACALAAAPGLIKNNALKSLHIEDNDITTDGAIAILKAAVANGVLQEVKIKNEYHRDDRVKEMIAVLEQRKNYKETEDHHRNTVANIDKN